MANLTTFITTTVINAAINTPKYYNKFRQIQKLLVQITLPYIFLVASIGLITNTATIVLISKSLDTKNAKHKWTLIALALSDIVHNTALSIQVIHDVSHSKIQQLCVIISFLSQLADLLSAGFTALFTIQRYTAVKYPLETAVQNQSSPIAIICLIFTSSVLFCLALIFENRHIGCHPELHLRWFIADALVSFIIPFTLILLFNIRIVILIRKQAKSFINKQSIHLQARKNRKTSSKDMNYPEITHSIASYTEHGDLTRVTMFETDFAENPVYYSSPKRNSKAKTSKYPIENPPLEASASLVSNENGCSNSQLSRTSSSLNRKHSNRISSKTQSIRVTRMLVLVSTCFLILNAPAHICMIIATIHSTIESPIYTNHAELDHFQQTTNLTTNQLRHFVFIEKNGNITNDNDLFFSNEEHFDDDDQILIHLLYLAVLITQLISYASYSINFFLYSYSGMTFRSNLRQCLRKFRKR